VVDVLNCRGANKVILNWQRPLWEGDHEIVKRSGRDKPMWVSIHKCMETMLGIAYLYLYPKLAKMLCPSYYLLFLFNKRAAQVLPGRGGGRGGRGPNNVYTCK
jgi:hypothetical protein